MEKKKGTQELEQLRLKQGLKHAQMEMMRLLELVRRASGDSRVTRGLHALDLARTGGGVWLRFRPPDFQ